MKSNDIQKTVDRYNEWPRFASNFFITCFTLLEKQNIPKGAAGKALQFTLDCLFYNCTFCFQNEQNFE